MMQYTTDDYKHMTKIGVYPNADGSLVVVYPSTDSIDGVRRKHVCRAAVEVIRQHYDQSCDEVTPELRRVDPPED